MDPTNILAGQGATILSIPIILQWMKNSDWRVFKWISAEKSRVSRIVAWTAGLIAASGIHGAFAVDPTGIYHITIDPTAFTLAGLMHGLFAGSGQLAGQEMVYKVVQIADRLDAFFKNPPMLVQGGTTIASPPPPPGV